MCNLLIEINGTVEEVGKVYNNWGYPMVEIGTQYYFIFEDSEEAGKAAKEHWQNIAENDPDEFTCMVGKESLIAWGLGRYGGPGDEQVSSLEDWLNLWLRTPEKHWASYDGEEVEARINKNLQRELGFSNSVVIYRHN